MSHISATITSKKGPADKDGKRSLTTTWDVKNSKKQGGGFMTGTNTWEGLTDQQIVGIQTIYATCQSILVTKPAMSESGDVTTVKYSNLTEGQLDAVEQVCDAALLILRALSIEKLK